jgi:hypothetical protein
MEELTHGKMDPYSGLREPVLKSPPQLIDEGDIPLPWNSKPLSVLHLRIIPAPP